jgi:hypothetical protein
LVADHVFQLLGESQEARDETGAAAGGAGWGDLWVFGHDEVGVDVVAGRRLALGAGHCRFEVVDILG